MKPIITTDIDGVAVQYASGLMHFAQRQGIDTKKIIECLVTEKFMPASELFNVNQKLAEMLQLQYHDSKYIRYLSGYIDAIQVINRLKEKYDFIAVTALGTSQESTLNRLHNLNTLFPGAFIDVRMVGMHDSKRDEFENINKQYDGVVCYVDDLLHHCESFESATGIQSLHMVRNPETRPVSPRVVKVANWYDVESILQEKEK